MSTNANIQPQDDSFIDPLGRGQPSGSLPGVANQSQDPGSYYTFSAPQTPGQQPSGAYDSLAQPSGVYAPQHPGQQPSSMYGPLGQSGPLPVQGYGSAGGTGGGGGRKRSLLTAHPRLLTAAIVLLFIIAGTAYAQSGHSLLHLRGAPQGTTTAQNTPATGQPTARGPGATATASPVMARPSPSPQPSPMPTATAIIPLKLPASWAPHSQLDAIEAATTALTFTQREMTIDYRSQGTLVAAKFILTPSAQARFNANDKRSSAAFRTMVQQTRLVESPVFTALPQVVQAQTQGQHFFAWVVVSFQLVVQHGANGTPTLEMNPQTNQPMLHQMVVLLVSVPFNGPQMGGIGWQVSDYALDQTGGLPPIPAQP